MKFLLTVLLLSGALTIGMTTISWSQDTTSAAANQPATTVMEEVAQPDEEIAAVEQKTFHQAIKEKFIEGGWPYMTHILLCFIVGLAIVIERIITLNLSGTNTRKLLVNVEEALNSGGVNGAREACKNTRGPVASIFLQGLLRITEGVDIVEKSIISYGSVEMGRLEKGLIWISLFISLAPMLGFFGTVVGMVQSFDAIEAAGDISPSLVAGGIKVALITTIAGLIVAMILQVFYNYLVSKIDSIVNQMEDASISFIDLLVKYNLSKAK